MADNVNVNLGGYSFKVVAIALLVGVMIGAAGAIHFAPTKTDTVSLTREQLVPQIVEQKVNVPYEVAREIVKEIPIVKEVKVPVKDPDRIITIPATPTTPTQQYNIILDRPREAGLMVTSHSAGLLVGYAPEKRMGYKLYIGKNFDNGGVDGGAAIVFRF